MMINIAILGATGTVGQKAIALLSGSKQFQIKELVASKSGMKYGDIVHWREPLIQLPPEIAQIKLSNIEDIECELILSCLTCQAAEYIEPYLAKRGKIIFSNSSAMRMKENIPLII